MVWPFKKKESEYNMRRRKLGMAPASDGDGAESVAFVVVLELLSPEVAAECKKLTAEDQSLFMMTYANYLAWLTKRAIESKFPPNSWPQIEPLLYREFSRQPWSKKEIMSKIWDSMISSMSTEGGGRYFDVGPMPWTDATLATNIAGYKLAQSTTMEFHLRNP